MLWVRPSIAAACQCRENINTCDPEPKLIAQYSLHSPHILKHDAIYLGDVHQFNGPWICHMEADALMAKRIAGGSSHWRSSEPVWPSSPIYPEDSAFSLQASHKLQVG